MVPDSQDPEELRVALERWVSKWDNAMTERDEARAEVSSLFERLQSMRVYAQEQSAEVERLRAERDEARAEADAMEVTAQELQDAITRAEVAEVEVERLVATKALNVRDDVARAEKAERERNEYKKMLEEEGYKL